MFLEGTCVRVGILLLLSALAAAQTTPSATSAPPSQSSTEGADTNPTSTVVWSLREEYSNLRGQPWNNVLLFRSDRIFWKDRHRIIGKRGILTRVDIPVVVAVRPDETRAGLGDIFGQVLLVPHLTKDFAFAAGSGISFPTATNPRLGSGKLVIAPVAVPVWFIPKRGFVLVKVQDYISVAGANDRPDLHFFTVTPTLVWRLQGKPYWFQLDAESRTDWKAQRHTGYKVGFLLGRMTRKRYGAWIKTEVGLGPYREATLAIKTSIFKVH